MRQITLIVLLLTLLTTTALSAELGAGKELKADKGPTLEQTTDFINKNIKPFTSDIASCMFDGSDCSFFGNDQSYKLVNCDYKFYLNNNVFKASIELNLANINSITVDLDEGEPAANFREFYNGKPVYKITLNINNNKVIYTENGKVKQYSSNEVPIAVKTNEYAKRLANAFEHAVQLCGGGKEIGKQELF